MKYFEIVRICGTISMLVFVQNVEVQHGFRI